MTQQRLLIVDDDETLNRMLCRAFERREFSCYCATTLKQAETYAQEHAIHYAIVDLKLAESSGLQLIPALLALQPHVKIVMLTGYSSIATAVTAIKLGATNYLSKPASAEEILAALVDQETHIEHDGSLANFTTPSVERLEWEHIQRVLSDHQGNISATARTLGMHRRTLQRKLNKRPVKQ